MERPEVAEKEEAEVEKAGVDQFYFGENQLRQMNQKLKQQLFLTLIHLNVLIQEEITQMYDSSYYV